jgi:hypothetical protein
VIRERRASSRLAGGWWLALCELQDLRSSWVDEAEAKDACIVSFKARRWLISHGDEAVNTNSSHKPKLYFKLATTAN